MSDRANPAANHGFSSLSLKPELLQVLTELGYSQPTPIQTQAIPAILAGQDIMAGAQTGSGKTAAFALPILNRLSAQTCLQKPEAQNSVDKPAIHALVLTPTRELALQVHGSFVKYAKQTQLKSALVYGGVSIDAQAQILAAGVDILVATPGRLLDHLRRGSLSLSLLEFLVFDEADRMLDMGFKDEIDAIVKQLPKTRQTLLFSATFDESLYGLSQSLLRDPKLIEVGERNAAAVEIEQRVYAVDSDRKLGLITHLIESGKLQQVLIFSRKKVAADKLAANLIKAGISAQAFHGDLSQGAREKVLQSFKDGEVRVLVATDVAARGIDIIDLNYVVNYELPYKAEDYVHRIGRTGRAGNKGVAITLLCREDEHLLEEVEAVLDKRLPQQWLAGFEPDLTKSVDTPKKGGRNAHKQRAKKRANGGRRGR
ncbi:DEAD/DEAH box helicase [Shewanella psychropiezotolerans]|uniref:DEAD/DEAH box helicase n=1 Tax=Shewanella psychropiezotolerans TaxID=2593655 RepID=A0ABX5WVB1_9GAMM|nr:MULTISPECIES: DEAD/DEAH box helicase [Shewanella]MPY22689.1 DEAD/DEAH box helicase [Shewanella sp. YLB-07]QDO83024.1 DEAD/DEAH box helicase [Shewanella psychropiezotolerans]